MDKIIEDAASSHNKKIVCMQQRILNGDLEAHINIRGSDSDTKGLHTSLKNATKPESLRDNVMDAQTEATINQMKRYSEIQNVDPLNQTIVRNFYTLRLLKTRGCKIKLLSLVNYFRAIQRTLALDLKEFVTREKAVGESKDRIEPHFGTDGNGRALSKQAAQSGPGKIFSLHLKRKLDADEVSAATTQDPVTLKSYKYNGKFNP